MTASELQLAEGSPVQADPFSFWFC